MFEFLFRRKTAQEGSTRVPTPTEDDVEVTPKDLRLVVMGPPGAGKGTQSPLIKKKYCICHLATGDMLRAAVSSGTKLGIQAKKVMEAGGLVNDEIMIGMIEDELAKNPECKNG